MDRHQFLSATLLAIAIAMPAHGAVDDARAKGLKWLVQTQKGDGSFNGLQGLAVQATAASVEAMLAGGMGSSPQHGRALSWLSNASGGSIDSRAWQVTAMAAAGRDASSIAGSIRDERNTSTAKAGAISTGNTALWGPFPGYAASAIDTALAFGALRNAGIAYANDTTELTVTALCHILPAQLAASPWNGAWPYALPQNGQPSHALSGSLAATALMLYEIKRQRQGGRFISGSVCSKTSPSAIDAALVSAKIWLVAQVNADGGFAERNPSTGVLEASSPMSTALAVRTLALFAAEGDSASTTAVVNARNWLAGQQNPDGSWRGDPFVTARVLAALPVAAGAQLADADNDGLPDVVEQQLGTQTTVADAQGVLATHANAQPGLTATSFSASGSLGEPFTYTLSAGGGTGPFTYTRTAGALPPGLILAANGQIAGTPSNTGSYAFDYEIADATGATTLVIGRIDIVDIYASSGDSDAPIPAWALLALGGALFAAIRRKSAG